jgi:hypothetical protein
LAIARCSNAAAVQGNGQATQAGDAGALDGSDDWQHVLAKSVSLPGGEGGLGSFRDHTPLLLGQSGIEVQHERIGISTEFGHNERDALDHQASNEGNIARESVELRHNDRALELSGKGEGGCQLWASIKSIRVRSGFDLGELLDDHNVLGFSEAGNGSALGLNAKARSTLPLC